MKRTRNTLLALALCLGLLSLTALAAALPSEAGGGDSERSDITTPENPDDTADENEPPPPQWG